MFVVPCAVAVGLERCCGCIRVICLGWACLSCRFEHFFRSSFSVFSTYGIYSCFYSENSNHVRFTSVVVHVSLFSSSVGWALR